MTSVDGAAAEGAAMAGVEVRRRRGKEVSLGRRLLSLVADWAVEIAAPWDEVWAEMGTTISEDAGWAEIDEIGGTWRLDGEKRTVRSGGDGRQQGL
ncbi:hypothetical protein M0R45_008886 [Rubus argutus]|uniref:Uncharacterized protein n=1 Tax=Rubus argutus TaxID=59490 RepID=A0AAW1Y2J7_RUBAR